MRAPRRWRAEMAKASSSVFGTTPPRAARREWRDKVNPPPYDWFETSAAHDGPPRQGVTAITIVTALLVPRTYVWNGTGFTKPGSKTRRWNLIRSVPINGLDDLLSHLKTLTPFEHVVMGKPAQDTPQLAKQKLSAKVHGDLRTILDTPRPYVICDCDSLPNLGDVDVTKLSPAKIHSFAVASLPEEFANRRLLDVLFELARHRPRQSESPFVFLAFTRNRKNPARALAQGNQRTCRSQWG